MFLARLPAVLDQADTPSCVTMSDDDNGLWYDEDCDQAFGVVCERLRDGETRPPTTVTDPSGACADSWFGFGDHCYQVYLNIFCETRVHYCTD